MRTKTSVFFLLVIIFLVGCSSNIENPFKDEILTKIIVTEPEKKNSSKTLLNQKELDQMKLYFEKVSWNNEKREMNEDCDYIMQIISEKDKKQHTRSFNIWINKDQSILLIDYEKQQIGNLSKKDAKDFKMLISKN